MTTTSTADDTTDASITASNPLLQDWSSQPFRLPPFDRIEPHHFPSALEMAMQQELSELQKIAKEPNPTFDNIIAAYDRAGQLCSRIQAVFSNLCSSLNTPELQEVQRDMAPILSRHSSACYQVPGLFDQIQTLYEKTHRSESSSSSSELSLLLSPEQQRLLERVYLDFTRAGAHLTTEQQQELTEIKAQLASYMTNFTQTVLHDEETWQLELKEDDMVGCPQSLKDAYRSDNDANIYILTTSRSLVEPFLTYSQRRDLRQHVFDAWTRRGQLSADRNNVPVAVDILRLRRRLAEIHGYSSFAAYQCADRMAQTPKAVMELLENVWERAKESTNKERASMEEFLAESGQVLDGGIQAWDWRFYAEQVRQSKYDLDESLLKPYLSLDNCRRALFHVSKQLFGLNYQKLDDIKLYHPDVDVYKVTEKKDGVEQLVAIFLHDNFARPFKSSGAWMSEYRSQTKNLGLNADSIESIPIVSNNNNFAKSETTLLSYDDAKTLFHEMGHGHHAMLSDATYARLASTNVLTDFVELPSQLMEHWLDQRQVLKEFARHYQTGESIPDQLLDKLEAAKAFQQGFQTVEYTACALMDMALHQMEDYPDDFDLEEFEKQELERLGMPQGVVMRHRPAHFQHLFSTNSYAAGYYVYLWADVLVADAFAAFEETGDCFDTTTAQRARKFIYSAGNTQSPDELFRLFRGRDPDISFLLKERHLT
jgi:peptidyl-dipeptidase Dcp